MKITQDLESGEIGIQLEKNETYYIEEQLDALMRFVTEQAVKNHELRKSYQKLVERFDVLEKKLLEKDQESIED
jgi:hypothetical protein